MKSKLYILFTVICCIGNLVNAQDLHFSQYHNAPLLINPANTGFIPDGDYRIGAHHRNQWSSVMSTPYKTFSVFGDAILSRDEQATGWLGLGGLLLRDVAGSGSLTVTRGYGSVAYHQMLGLGSLLSLGFNAGFANKRINSSELKFPDQFDGNFFDGKLPTSAILSRGSITYLDVQAGMNYAFFPNNNTYFNFGFSSHHLNKPSESFFEPVAGQDNRVPIRHTAFVNASFKLNDWVILNPNSYFSYQAKATEWLIGANVHYNASGDGDAVLIGGAYLRNADALIPLVGVGYKDYIATFTYDATISNMKQYNYTRGAFEFSIIKQGLFDRFNGNKTQSLCPKF